MRQGEGSRSRFQRLQCLPSLIGPAAAQDGRPLWISELGSVRVTALVNNVGIDTFMDFHIHLMEWKVRWRRGPARGALPGRCISPHCLSPTRPQTLQLDRLSREKNFLVRMLVIRDLTGVGMHMLTKRARTLFSRVRSTAAGQRGHRARTHTHSHTHISCAARVRSWARRRATTPSRWSATSS